MTHVRLELLPIRRDLFEAGLVSSLPGEREPVKPVGVDSAVIAEGRAGAPGHLPPIDRRRVWTRHAERVELLHHCHTALALEHDLHEALILLLEGFEHATGLGVVREAVARRHAERREAMGVALEEVEHAHLPVGIEGEECLLHEGEAQLGANRAPQLVGDRDLHLAVRAGLVGVPKRAHHHP